MNHTVIIAEAGVNHNGSMQLARQLIDAAAAAGADYVKFQTFRADKITSAHARRATYQRNNIGNSDSDDTQLGMLRKLELTYNDFAELSEYCTTAGIRFLSTPFDIESVHFLASLGMDYMKIPSGEITNLPYLRAVARTGIPVIMSTGMSALDEIADAMHVLTASGMSTDSITLLHCNTEYPTPMHDVNLRVMDTLRREFGTRVGYSDHTQGIEVPVAAVAIGAQVIEKHFTLDKTLPGPDHVASLDPAELTAMVSAIRNVEAALGSCHKHVTDSERPNIAVARKSIVAAKPIARGQLFTESNLTVKRPGTGISPMLWDSVIGTASTRDYITDELIDQP